MTKWSLETNPNGIFLKMTGDSLTAEEAKVLAGSLSRASEILLAVTGKKMFPCDSLEQRRTSHKAYGMFPKRISKKKEKKWNS